MTFLLDHLPPQVHLVISTRADPALPLARLRARGELVEIRAADLRFTDDEAAAYLNDLNGARPRGRGRRRARRPHRGVGGGPAAGGAVPAAVVRTRRRSSPGSPATTGSSWTTSPTRSSTGSHPTSAGSCWTPPSSTGSPAPLCDAVTGSTGGKADAGVAGAAEPVPRPARRPPPLVPLPPPLRRRAPRASARRTTRATSPSCTGAPASWYDQAGDPEAAVRHALAAGDVDLAADAGRARHPGAAARAARGDHLPLGRPAARRHRGEPARARRRVRRRPHRRATSSTVVEQRLRDVERLLADARRRRWSWSTTPSWPGCRRPWPRTGPPSRWSAVTWPAPWSTPSVRPGPRRRRRPAHHRVRVRAPRARVLDERRPATRHYQRVPRRRGEPRAARGTSPTSSAARITLADIEITQGRLGEAQRTCERRPRAGRAGRRRRRAGQPTCTSG